MLSRTPNSSPYETPAPRATSSRASDPAGAWSWCALCKRPRITAGAVWEPRASQPVNQSAIFERDAACSATAHLCLRISTSLLLESTRRCTPCAPPIAVHQMCGNRSFGANAAHLGYELVPVGTILFMRRCFRSASSCSSCGSHRSSVAVRSCTERQNRAYSLSVMRGHQPQIGFGFNLMSTFKLILGASRHRLSRKFWKFASTHGSRCDRAPEPAS